jgi:HSP20 family protein
MVRSRWQPLWNEMQRFQHEVNQLFHRGSLSQESPTYPPLNVWADDDNVYVEAELPGMTQDQLEIFVSEGNQLTINGERRPCEMANTTWHRQERGYGKFSRTVTLPVLVEADRVEARLEQGVLRLTLPKSPAAKPRKISVKGE